MSLLDKPQKLDDLEERFGRLIAKFAAAWRQAGGGTGKTLEQLKLKLEIIEGKIDKVMAKQEEAQAELEGIKTEVTAIGGDIDTLLEKVKALEEAAANGEVPDNIFTQIKEIRTGLEAVDAKFPEAPPTA